MDTKSKSFKNTIGAKTICVFLSLFFALGSAVCTVLSVGTLFFCGSFDCFGSPWELEQTGAYNEVMQNFASQLIHISLSDEDVELRKRFESEREKTVSDIWNSFLDEKSEIIKAELTWCYENYSQDSAGIDRETLGEILNTANGQDYLQYAGYVRYEALNDSFNYKIELSGDDGEVQSTSFYIDYNNDDNYVKEIINNNYLGEVSEYFNMSEAETSISRLAELRNFSYCVKTGSGIQYTNMDDVDKELGALTTHKVYLSYSQGKLTQKGLDCSLEGEERARYYSGISIDTMLKGVPEDVEISFYVSDNITYGDIFYRLNKGFEMFGAQNTLLYVILSLALFACAVIALIVLLCLCGHVNGSDEIKLSGIDRVPTDIHTLISLAFSGGLIFVGVIICYYGLRFDLHETIITDFLFSLPVVIGCAVLCALSWLVLIEWSASVVRLKKSGASYFRKFLGVQFLCWLGRGIKRLFSLALYKPKRFKKNVVALCIILTLVELLLIFMTVNAYDFIIALGTFMLFLGFNAVVLIKLLHYIESLDEIISASSERRTPNVSVAALPTSLKSLVSSMSVTQSELDRAVTTAVQDERMKTELITNVSHDLKTPLTSIISYVDLLKRCDITDETAKGYLVVLEEKSARLKTLVEDLVEASKASSGSVTLNCTQLNLTELVLQATGEMGGDFENAGLELVFDEPETSPIIFADGQKTYRVIENLFNNARKYSVDGSRVYVEVVIDGNFGCMKIKNVSRQKLNISPDELTARFVRGDSSRTDGGSGLGLAIAKDLCALQSGELEISIDGDLFKATVKLPLFREN